MCGIVGFQGEFPADLLARMSQAVAHRGPDGDGCVTLGNGGAVTTGLAHRRLAIIDLSSHGLEPMTVCCPACGSSSLEDLALVYNGELYNFPEIRTELLSRGHVFHSRTDSEVLLHLWAERGPAMLDRLNGIFAFAIADGRERGRAAGIERGDLFLARDQLGVKPLYYLESPRGFAFASELKAILRDEEFSRQLDLEALHYHLAYLWTPAPRTLVDGVRKLPPGRAMVVREGRIARQWAYYDIPYGRPLLGQSMDALAHELHARLESAVRRQLIADVPVGAFLSGGLDSSTIVSMVRRAEPQRAITCYCIGFAGNDSVEGNPADLPYATQVAKHLGVRLNALQIQPGVIDQLERMLYFLDEPQADAAPINAMLIAEQARHDGIPVLLSGAGGDDVFSGYRRHLAVRMERMWGWLPTFVRTGIGSTARAIGSGYNVGGMRFHTPRRVLKALAFADFGEDERTASYFWWSADAVRRQLYSPAVAAATAGLTASTPLVESLQRIPEEHDPLNRMLYLEAKHFLADHNLNYTDKMGMASGVEIRVPLLDIDLVDFATRIPPSFKQRGLTGKAILKRAMEPDLPRSVIYRKKSGFGVPLRRWLHVELRDRVQDALSTEAITKRGLFNPQAVRELISLDSAGKIDGAYTIFALMCVELWCRMFIDRPGVM